MDPESTHWMLAGSVTTNRLIFERQKNRHPFFTRPTLEISSATSPLPPEQLLKMPLAELATTVCVAIQRTTVWKEATGMTASMVILETTHCSVGLEMTPMWWIQPVMWLPNRTVPAPI